MARRAILIGAGAAAAAARLTRDAYRARRKPEPNGYRLTVRASVAPQLVEDLADLLRRVTGRAASDPAGSITVKLAPGVSAAEIEKELRNVVHRWSEMHPEVRVRVSADGEISEQRRWRRRRVARDEESAAVGGSSMLAAPPHSS